IFADLKNSVEQRAAEVGCFDSRCSTKTRIESIFWL
ncbi:Os11g0220100, partial [Oryza sativa Japonica Group]